MASGTGGNGDGERLMDQVLDALWLQGDEREEVVAAIRGTPEYRAVLARSGSERNDQQRAAERIREVLSPIVRQVHGMSPTSRLVRVCTALAQHNIWVTDDGFRDIESKLLQDREADTEAPLVQHARAQSARRFVAVETLRLLMPLSRQATELCARRLSDDLPLDFSVMWADAVWRVVPHLAKAYGSRARPSRFAEHVRRHGLLAMAYRALQRSPDVMHRKRQECTRGITLRHRLCTAAHAVVLITECGASVTDRDARWNTALHTICENATRGPPDLHLITVLLATGCPVDAVNDNGWTPLAVACFANASPIVVLGLLQFGASPNARDSFGQTPVHHAVASGRNPHVVAMLYRHGADLNAKDDNGQTPMHLAGAYGHTSMGKVLIRLGARLDVYDSDARTPLEYASQTSPELTRIWLPHSIRQRQRRGIPVETCASLSLSELLPARGMPARHIDLSNLQMRYLVGEITCAHPLASMDLRGNPMQSVPWLPWWLFSGEDVVQYRSARALSHILVAIITCLFTVDLLVIRSGNAQWQPLGLDLFDTCAALFYLVAASSVMLGLNCNAFWNRRDLVKKARSRKVAVQKVTPKATAITMAIMAIESLQVVSLLLTNGNWTLLPTVLLLPLRPFLFGVPVAFTIVLLVRGLLEVRVVCRQASRADQWLYWCSHVLTLPLSYHLFLQTACTAGMYGDVDHPCVSTPELLVVVAFGMFGMLLLYPIMVLGPPFWQESAPGFPRVPPLALSCTNHLKACMAASAAILWRPSQRKILSVVIILACTVFIIATARQLFTRIDLAMALWRLGTIAIAPIVMAGLTLTL
ncbi:Ankyrin repeat domain-containing protein [Plasmodiophora brassicae]|uniref:Uncharacterized protein n=1 Tax=Plasmodiophora brassicae TaxID=37360 RepID=A0A0G4J6Q4_PLABS|nr:hypothetical protein PBRA_002942 [Plasmodiophora brassicae]SPQ95426.1 unnamed protein product [Plasmodiophora brassicae]